MTWIDTGIIAIIIGIGLFIFYRALRDPIDLMLHHLKNLVIWIKDSIQNSSGNMTTFQEIRYG